MPPPVVLTVAASDPLGGAGLAADLTTFALLGVHGTLAVTAVTAQRLGAVDQVDWVAPELVAAQVDAAAAELPPAAVKTGLLGSPEVVDLLADRVVSGRLPPPVVDPVLVDGRGRPIVTAETVAAYRRLIGVAALATPNVHEARLLAGAGEDASTDTLAALLGEAGTTVVVTGGAVDATDTVMVGGGPPRRLPAEAVDTRDVRGSGCTFAAAVAARLAAGDTVEEAIDRARAFVRTCLRASAGWDLTRPGPVCRVVHD